MKPPSPIADQYSTPEELAFPWPENSFVPVHWEHDMGPFAFVIQNPKATCPVCRREWFLFDVACPHCNGTAKKTRKIAEAELENCA